MDSSLFYENKTLEKERDKLRQDLRMLKLENERLKSIIESQSSAVPTEKEMLAIKAEHYLVFKSKRLQYGGTYLENIHDIEHCGRISFREAVAVVESMILRFCGEENA